MSAGLSVKTAVVGGIAAVALLSQVLSGIGQYLGHMAMGREQRLKLRRWTPLCDKKPRRTGAMCGA